jgi:hypothetical protein
MRTVEAAGPFTSAARPGRAVWVWPLAGALFAAWPVWRSFFAEVPDVGQGALRGQVAAAIGELVLVGCWIARYRERMTSFYLPLVAMGFAAIVLIMASVNSDAPAVDLSALAICWLAVVFLFAGAVLLDGQRAFAEAQRSAVPQVRMLLPAHERIGYWLLAIAVAAVAALRGTPQGFLLAALAAVSPGAVMIWSALSDTARSVLARRRVYAADLPALPALAGHTDIVLGDPGMLIGSRPKVISIMPVGETKPGEIVGIAAALLAEDQSDAARGLQEFGVSHRLRVPAIKSMDASGALHRGRLPDRRVVEVGPIEDSAIDPDDRAPFAEQLARAAELHRIVLALREVEPAPRLLGLIVLAKAARPGATEAVRTLRKASFTIALADAAVDPKDQEALSGLEVKSVADWPKSAIGLVRPGQPPIESCAATIQFGGRAPSGGEWNGDIIIARDDPRTLVDLLQFARDFRIRTRTAIIAANLPGIAFLAAALGLVPASPLFVTVAALTGIALAVVVPQALRLSPTLANEVDEE